MTEDLLLEIGTEEIPAAFMPNTLASMKDLVEKQLLDKRISFSDITTYGTPRRIILVARGVAASQEDLVTQKIGPGKKIAYDQDGNPTKAAIGFAKGQGIDVDKLGTVKTEKGVYICAEIKEQGVQTATLLPELLTGIINSLPFPKSMRWGDLDIRFARPIHWITALFGNTTVPFTIGNIQSGNTTRGHRFMSPGPITVSGITEYLEKLKKAHVIVDPDERKKIIADNIREHSRSAEGVPDTDEDLLDEVTWLVESPYPVGCRFDEEYLALPAEVLLTTMKKHQRYFPVLGPGGKPLSTFIAVNNTDTTDPAVVVNGHERVLRARLADARFFYAEDQKKSLDAMTEDLKTVVFQSQLGTSYEKVMRFQKLALLVADELKKADLKPLIERSSYLCKADLVSEMVGEFPELQGIMGREYAKLAGEPEGVAQAIYEHYLPRFAGDVLPATDIGATVSIADKLDTIAGCFGVGLIPTGTADPYALRRQCLGIINIILHKKYTLSLAVLVERAVCLLETKINRSPEDIHKDVLAFFSGRLVNLLTSQGRSYDAVDAVLSLGIDDLTDSAHRIESLDQMKQDPDFESLAISFKRVVNILADTAAGSVDAGLFETEEEKNLYGKYTEINGRVQQLIEQKSYSDALKVISTIREAVDGFFDNVLVMAKDEKVKQNRLALLHAISSLFTNFADFSKISSE